MSPTKLQCNDQQIPIVIVAGCCFRYDAISAAVFDTFDALSVDSKYEITLLSSYNEVTERKVEIVADATSLLLHPKFRAAELIIYHFGIYHPLFDVMPIGNGRARQAAFFHNITPVEFAPPTATTVIVQSYNQLQNLRYMDRVWPVSQTNVETLLGLDFKTVDLDTIPLAVSTPVIIPLSTKRIDKVEILFLSRIVRAKGIIDLIEAIAALPRTSTPPFRLRIAGNVAHSDGDCIATVKSLLVEKELADHVEILGTVDDSERDYLLTTSHILAIPSYHEGFCKPAIEGLRAGCIPIGYSAYNLRYITGGLSRMVSAGDIGALSAVLSCLIDALHATARDPMHKLVLDGGPYGLKEFDAAAAEHVAQFDPGRIGHLTKNRIDKLLNAPKEVVTPFLWTSKLDLLDPGLRKRPQPSTI